MNSLTEYLDAYDMTDRDLEELERRLEEEWQNGDPQAHQMAMVYFLDRLGKDGDLYGVEWSILHGLEALKNHEEAVVRNWKPTYWRKLLLKRLANAGVTAIGGQDIQKYLDDPEIEDTEQRNSGKPD